MNKDKWSYLYIILIIFFSCINILICFNILPFDVWRVGLIVTVLVNMLISLKKKDIKAKDRKLTIIYSSTVLI